MKVLWITNRPIAAGERKYNIKATSGTWMEPTLNEMKNHPEIKLSVATVANISVPDHMEEDGVEYYFLPKGKKAVYDYRSKKNIESWKRIIEKTSPDIIMIWGTEYAHGLCALRAAGKIPSVIMIQGIIDTVAKNYLGGMTREEASSGSSSLVVFAICAIFIYLILCALYESIFIPIVILLSVPFGLAGSFLFARMFGLENNIYLQVGLLMLIGLLAKTAILLTQYASEKRRQGMSIAAAAISAAKVRFRPILMTSLTMIFGMLPLMFSRGVGANGNNSIGVGTVGGLLIGTIALLFIVPVLIMVFMKIEEKVMPRREKED